MVLAAKKDSTEPDYWKIPAGGVERKEDLETALKREMLEEIGILENDLEVLAKSKHTDKFTWPKEISQRKQKETGVWCDGQERCIFICKLKTADYKFKLQEEEIADVKWFNKEDYEKHLLFPSQVELMKKVIEVYNRKNNIGILSNKMYFRYIDGINYSLYKELFRTNKSGQFFGELIGPTINGNAYNEERNIWLPFSYLREKCEYKFWNKFLETEIENKDLCEKEIFEKVSNVFKDLWSLYYRRKTGEKIFAEGIVFYNKETEEMCKLRRDMFEWFDGSSHDFYKIKANK